jgi:hypothetical protein
MKKFRNLRGKIISGVAKTLAGAVLLVAACSLKSQYISPKIESEADLYKTVSIEKSRLGLNNTNINAKIVNPGYKFQESDMTKYANAWCAKEDDGYCVYLVKGNGDTVDGVKHELYHIKKGDCEGLKYEDINPPCIGLVEKVFGDSAGVSYWNNYKDLMYTLRYPKQEVCATIYGATRIKL